MGLEEMARPGGRRRNLAVAALFVSTMLASSLAAPAQTSARAGSAPSCFGKAATYVGTPGDDVIKTGPDNNVIAGGGGDDVIDAGAGHDLICGGDGDDVLVGDIGDDRIHGGEGADRLYGGLDRDLLIGAAGGDELGGGDMDDTLAGGEGPDLLGGGDGGDLVPYRRNRRPVEVDLATGVASGAGADSLTGIEHAIGSRHDDVIMGSSVRNLLSGGRGDDHLAGRGGYDRLSGGSGDDLLHAGGGSAEASFERARRAVTVALERGTARGQGTDRLVGISTVTGSRFGDVIRGDELNNSLWGLGGPDSLSGLGGGDLLAGGRGGDSLGGGAGSDRLTFWGASQPVEASLQDGRARGEGRDSISGFESLIGSAGPDVLEGDGGRNYLEGAGGRDLLRGRAGDDSLSGGVQQDRSYGGWGSDTCDTTGGDDYRGCESLHHGDPAGEPTLIYPARRAVIDNAEFRRVYGGVKSGVTRVTRVSLALRWMSETGCRWWSHGDQKLLVGSCARPVFFDARFTNEDKTRWAYRFGKTLRTGRYEIQARGGFTSRFRLD